MSPPLFLSFFPGPTGERCSRSEIRKSGERNQLTELVGGWRAFRKHFEGLKPHLDSGAFKMGGAVLNSVPVGDDPTKWEFGGSTIIVVAESKDEVLDMLRRDIYTESGVWDVEKVRFFPQAAD